MRKLDDNNFLEEIKMFSGTEGIYHIYSFKNNKPQAISRLALLDDTGLLYIGSTKNLKERLGMLYRVTLGVNRGYTANAHTFGEKYNNNEKIRKLFPMNTLFVDIEITKSYKIREAELLRKYLNEFGELPPLNSNYPKP